MMNDIEKFICATELIGDVDIKLRYKHCKQKNELVKQNYNIITTVWFKPA